MHFAGCNSFFLFLRCVLRLKLHFWPNDFVFNSFVTFQIMCFAIILILKLHPPPKKSLLWKDHKWLGVLKVPPSVGLPERA